MAEYISREEAIKELREVYENEYPTASGDFDEYASHDVPNVLRNMPFTYVQPVKIQPTVHCKDCKYAQNPNDTMVYCTYFECGTMSQDDFCSQGDRRTENG